MGKSMAKDSVVKRAQDLVLTKAIRLVRLKVQPKEKPDKRVGKKEEMV